MKVLISGGGGYIGSNLLSKIIKEGITAGVLGRNPDLPVQSNLINFYKADITQPLEIDLKQEYDTFIHLAAANDIDSLNPKAAILTTVLGTKHCLELCKKHNIKKFIYFSTFQVYGKVSGIMNEETQLEPINDYAITHQFAEDYVKMYSRISNVKHIIVRPTNIYGAPVNKGIDRWTLVPNCFCKEAFEKQSITLMSSGKQTRDFIDLNDLSNITINLCKSFDKYENTVVNGASGNNFTIIEIAEIVKDEYQKFFNQECNLFIKSEHPLEANQVNVKTEIVKSTGYMCSDKESIKKEIKDIFRLLESN